MYVSVHKPKTIGSGTNKGSSYDMMNYLNKENKDLDLEEQTFFFNQFRNDMDVDDSIKLIDENVIGSKLGKNDAKYYMLSIDPSHSEIKHMIMQTTGKEVNSFDELSKEDKEKFFNGFQSFVNNSMGHYAELMDREIDGRKMDVNDLVYSAKIETERIYKPESKEVQENLKINREIKELRQEGEHKNAKEIDRLTSQLNRNKDGEVIRSGMKKDGLNVHAHIVVSRMDKEQTTKMSPLANHIKKDNHKVGENQGKIGFSRHDFALRVENQFDNQFEYKRQYENSTYHRLKSERDSKIESSLSQGVGTAYSGYSRLMSGRFDTLDFVEFAAKVGFKMAKEVTNTALSISTAGTTTTAKVVEDIAKMNPEKFAKMAAGGLNSKEQTLVDLSKINPLENMKSTANFKVKEIIKSGGTES